MRADGLAFTPGCTGCSIFIATLITSLVPLTLYVPLNTNPNAPLPSSLPRVICCGRIRYFSPRSRNSYTKKFLLSIFRKNTQKSLHRSEFLPYLGPLEREQCHRESGTRHICDHTRLKCILRLANYNCRFLYHLRRAPWFRDNPPLRFCN